MSKFGYIILLFFAFTSEICLFAQKDTLLIKSYQPPSIGPENFIFPKTDFRWIPYTSYDIIKYYSFSGHITSQVDFLRFNHRYFEIGLFSVLFDRNEPGGGIGASNQPLLAFPFALKMPLLNKKFFDITFGTNWYLFPANLPANQTNGISYHYPEYTDCQLLFETKFKFITVNAMCGFRAQFTDYTITGLLPYSWTGNVGGFYTGISVSLSITGWHACHNPGIDSYEKAKKLNQVEAYTKFILKYPNTPYAEELDQRREYAYYIKILNHKRLEDCTDYFAYYPNGRYLKEVVMLFKEIKALNEANLGGKKECESYLNTFPESQFVDQVQKRNQMIIDHEETMDYKQALIGTYKECDTYLTKYPNGKHFKEIEELRKKQFEERISNNAFALLEILNKLIPKIQVKAVYKVSLISMTEEEAIDSLKNLMKNGLRIDSLRIIDFDYDSTLSNKGFNNQGTEHTYKRLVNINEGKSGLSIPEICDEFNYFKIEKFFLDSLSNLNHSFLNSIDSLRKLKIKAEEGDVNAQIEIGKRMDQGAPPFEKNVLDAIKWFQMASNNNSALAKYLLAELYSSRKLILDKNTAFLFYLESAKLGSLEGMDKVGKCYYFGDGVKKDPIVAIDWYSKAADAGSSEAQDFIGNCYQNGVVMPINVGKAIQYFRMAAEQGEVDAMNAMGLIYKRGEWVPQDLKEAEAWFAKGAAKGDETCKKNLDMLYKLKNSKKK